MANNIYKYEVLSHTADLKIRVFGSNKEELFSNAVLAMQDCLKSKSKNQSSEIRDVEIKSSSLETLLVDFLSEVLYLTQVNKEVYNKIKFEEFSDIKIKAKLYGKKAESFGEDIKGITYHDLTIAQQSNGTWEAVILFDI